MSLSNFQMLTIALCSRNVRVTFWGPMGFFKKANDYNYLVLGMYAEDNMVVGSPGIVAVNSYDAINMAPVKNTHQYCRFFGRQTVDIA